MSVTLQQVNPAALSARLLEWYDRHRRVLPWRALAGEIPDPYRVWLSEIMLATDHGGDCRALFSGIHAALAAR
jgi:hypothetical protein